MNTQGEATTPPAPRELPRPNRYQDLPTATILAEAEVWAWHVEQIKADLEADPTSWRFPQESLAFAKAALAEADEVLARRERLASRPTAPRWPADHPHHLPDAQAIKAALSLPRYIGMSTGAVLERRGKWSKELWCCCPLPGHQERTPSFPVNEAKGVFYCFGCHRSGDLFTFAAHLHGTARFDELLPILAEAAGLSTGGGRRG